MVKRNQSITDPGLAIDLEVSGRQSVTVDNVRFLSFDGVPSPELVDATVDGGTPAVGFVVRPQKDYGGAEPKLILKVRTDQATAYNRLVQVRYHDQDGTGFAALFDMHWVMCLKAEMTQQDCVDKFHAQLYGSPTTSG